jgi:hypothetical protein
MEVEGVVCRKNKEDIYCKTRSISNNENTVHRASLRMNINGIFSILARIISMQLLEYDLQHALWFRASARIKMWRRAEALYLD